MHRACVVPPTARFLDSVSLDGALDLSPGAEKIGLGTKFAARADVSLRLAALAQGVCPTTPRTSRASYRERPTGNARKRAAAGARVIYSCKRAAAGRTQRPHLPTAIFCRAYPLLRLPAPARGNGAVQKARIIVPVARATIVLIEVRSCCRALWTRPKPTTSVTQESASITTFRCVRRLAASSEKLFMTRSPKTSLSLVAASRRKVQPLAPIAQMDLTHSVNGSACAPGGHAGAPFTNLWLRCGAPQPPVP